MNPNRRLIDAIKAGFTRKASAQLLAVVQTGPNHHWSPEAVTAAEEVLADRRAGRAAEPANPEPDDAPPESTYDPEVVALGLLAGLVAGAAVVPYALGKNLPELDMPVPFGPRMAWLAVATADTPAVAAAVGLRKPRSVAWLPGVEAAHRGEVFVTPPVGDWTLAVGTPLFHTPDATAAGVTALLATLGKQFEEVQYFASHRDVGLLTWALARRGQLVSGFASLGERVLWDAGTPTPDEAALGLRSAGGQPERVVPLSEDDLFQLAGFWSVDPNTLSVEFAEPAEGLLGTRVG